MGMVGQSAALSRCVLPSTCVATGQDMTWWDVSQLGDRWMVRWDVSDLGASGPSASGKACYSDGSYVLRVRLRRSGCPNNCH